MKMYDEAKLRRLIDESVSTVLDKLGHASMDVGLSGALDAYLKTGETQQHFCSNEHTPKNCWRVRCGLGGTCVEKQNEANNHA